jgi:hypothetical protein
MVNMDKKKHFCRCGVGFQPCHVFMSAYGGSNNGPRMLAELGLASVGE